MTYACTKYKQTLFSVTRSKHFKLILFFCFYTKDKYSNADTENSNFISEVFMFINFQEVTSMKFLCLLSYVNIWKPFWTD